MSLTATIKYRFTPLMIGVSMPGESPYRAVVFALAAATMLAMMDGIIKLLVQSYPVIIVAWIRFALMTGFLAAATIRPLGWSLLMPRAWTIQLVRAVAAVLATGLFYAGLSRLPLAESTAIMCLAPAIAALAARLFLNEHVSQGQWLGLTASLLGALLIARPGGALFTPAVVLPLAASAAFALFIVMSRMASQRDDPRVTSFWTCLGGFLLFSLLAPFFWTGIETEIDCVAFLAIGVLGALGQLATTWAYRHGPTALVAPIGYASLVVAALLGWMMFRDALTVASVAGMALIALGGVLVVNGSRRQVS